MVKKLSSREDNMRRAAIVRAESTAFIGRNPGVTAQGVFAGIHHAISEYTEQQLGNLLSGMAKNGLIRAQREGMKNFYFPADSKPEVASTTQTVVKPKRPPKDIELNVGGTTIIIGRNAATGRLRITIEEN